VQIRVGSKTGRPVNFDQNEDCLRNDLAQQKQSWLNRLASCPSQFESIEREIHAYYRRNADEMVAGLLQAATKTLNFQTHSKK
jgi:hypothetical protein